MDFIRSVLAQDYAPSADETKTWDLPVNPLAYVSFVIKALNVTDEATLANLLALVTNITVAFNGQSILNMTAADLYAYNVALLGRVPIFTNLVSTDNATRSVGLVIPFGRKIMDPSECFPQARKGELSLQATLDIATAEADGLIIQAETTELPGAQPRSYLKATTLTATPAATGQFDIELPKNNPLLGCLLWGTTVPTSTAWTATIDQARVLADNVEKGYAQANWESIHADLINRSGMPLGAEDAWTTDAINNYALIDYDPMKDGQFELQTAQLNDLKLRIEAGDTNPLRIIPIERVPIG